MLVGEGFLRLDLRGTEVRWGAGKSCKEGAEEAMVPDQIERNECVSGEWNADAADAEQKEAHHRAFGQMGNVPPILYVSVSRRWALVCAEGRCGNCMNSIAPPYLSASHRAFASGRELRHTDGWETWRIDCCAAMWSSRAKVCFLRFRILMLALRRPALREEPLSLAIVPFSQWQTREVRVSRPSSQVRFSRLYEFVSCVLF